MSVTAKSCAGVLKRKEFTPLHFVASKVLMSSAAILAGVDHADCSVVQICHGETGLERSNFHMDTFYVSCFCWGPCGETLLLASTDYVNVLEIDQHGTYTRGMYTGFPVTAIACDAVRVACCTESKEDTWPKVLLMDYATGNFLQSFGSFGLDNGLVSIHVAHVAMAGDFIIMADDANEYLTRVDRVGNFARVTFASEGLVVALCTAHNGKDVYVTTSKVHSEVKRVNVLTGAIQNTWCLPGDDVVSNVSCCQHNRTVTVFSKQTQRLYFFA